MLACLHELVPTFKEADQVNSACRSRRAGRGRMSPHESLMRLALEEAEAAFREGEVPVGAVVAKDGRPVPARTTCASDGDPTAHAELLAIREARARWARGG